MISSEPAFTICGEADRIDTALQVTAATSPHLAIVDLSLADGHGLDLIQALRKIAPDLPVLVLSMHDEELFAERALRAGARGYVMKDAAIGDLVHAMHEVLSGRIYVSERVSQHVLKRLTAAPATATGGALGGLTDRELQVFEMIGAGHTTAGIAKRLTVSVKTIETYRANIKAKLNLKDANDLLRYATTWTEGL
jgi:DNA-binding NarL/FixJ family response regulator